MQTDREYKIELVVDLVKCVVTMIFALGTPVLLTVLYCIALAK